jgi:hypothetical protein
VAFKKKPQVLLPAAHDHPDSALITASRPLPKGGPEEAKAEAIIDASFLPEIIRWFISITIASRCQAIFSPYTVTNAQQAFCNQTRELSAKGACPFQPAFNPGSP